MDFGAMIKVAMLLLSKRDQIGQVLGLVREVSNAIGGQPPPAPPPGVPPAGSMAWLQESLNKLNNAGLEGALAISNPMLGICAAGGMLERISGNGLARRRSKFMQ